MFDRVIGFLGNQRLVLVDPRVDEDLEQVDVFELVLDLAGVDPLVLVGVEVEVDDKVGGTLLGTELRAVIDGGA